MVGPAGIEPTTIYQNGIRCGYWNEAAARSMAELLDGGQTLSACAISAHPRK